MTSQTNARELDRLRKARDDAHQRFAKQMMLLDQIESTATQLEATTRTCHGQLAALVKLSGTAVAAAEISGLPKSGIDVAVKTADSADVQAAVAGAKPTRRRRAAHNAVNPSSGAPSPESGVRE